jgi:hypothetical protein
VEICSILTGLHKRPEASALGVCSTGGVFNLGVNSMPWNPPIHALTNRGRKEPLLDLAFPRGPGVGERQRREAFDAVAAEYTKQARELEQARARIAELEGLLAQRGSDGAAEDVAPEPETSFEDKPKGVGHGRKGKGKASEERLARSR